MFGLFQRQTGENPVQEPPSSLRLAGDKARDDSSLRDDCAHGLEDWPDCERTRSGYGAGRRREPLEYESSAHRIGNLGRRGRYAGNSGDSGPENSRQTFINAEL
jgi:hypothetical protein